MRNNALFERYEVFVAAGVVGSHAHGQSEGFRQRDVKFLIELFSNWVEHSLKFKNLTFQNTQVARYIEQLVADGFARVVGATERPRYKLTRPGLIELVSRMVNEPYYGQPEQFYFINYFIENYKTRILDLVKAEGKQFPYSLEVELTALLDTSHLRERQIAAAEKELQILDVRIADALKTSRLAIELFAKGRTNEEVVAKIEELYPYELNSQKPLSELFGEMPADVRRWELEVGTVRRAHQIWMPSRVILVQFIRSLREMAATP